MKCSKLSWIDAIDKNSLDVSKAFKFETDEGDPLIIIDTKEYIKGSILAFANRLKEVYERLDEATITPDGAAYLVEFNNED